MLDDFFIRALVAGIGIACVAGPLGCFILWRRMAYFGDTLAHSALMGAALSILLNVNTTATVFTICALIALAMVFMEKKVKLSSDSLLGLLAHSSLAIGLLVLAFLSGMRIDLMGLLFGDILSVNKQDILTIYLGGFIVLAILVMIWRRLFAATVNPELAEAEGMAPERVNLVFMILMAGVIAIALKIVGVLLITALLILPAAAARHFARSPEGMAVLASVFGVTSVIAGLFSSLHYDSPSGPSIVVAALILFLAGFMVKSFVRPVRARPGP